MRLLLDTHIAIWAAIDPIALSEAERTLLGRIDTQLALSAVVVWEVRLKWIASTFPASAKAGSAPAPS